MREGWVISKLFDVAERSTLKNLNQVDLVFTVSAKWGLIKQEDFFTKRVASKNLTNYYLVQPGDYVFNKSYSTDAPFGVIARNNGVSPGLVSPIYIVFRAKHRFINQDFLGLALNSPIFWESLEGNLKEGGRGHGALNLKVADFFEALLPVPPLPDQKRIVDLISSIDSYIESLQQLLDTAKRSRNAVLHELLVVSGDDWNETTLAEICKSGLFADGDWVESKDQDPEGDFRLLQLADIGDGTFLDKSDRWMNQEQFIRLGCTKLEVHDVLIARMPDPIGRACLFPEGMPVCATVVDVAIVRTGDEILQRFLGLMINASEFRTEAFSLLTGTTRQRISRGNLAKIRFAIPSTEKQLEIVNFMQTFDTEITNSMRAVEETKNLRSGLLSDLLSGEHQIPASYDKVLDVA